MITCTNLHNYKPNLKQDVHGDGEEEEDGVDVEDAEDAEDGVGDIQQLEAGDVEDVEVVEDAVESGDFIYFNLNFQ